MCVLPGRLVTFFQNTSTTLRFEVLHTGRGAKERDTGTKTSRGEFLHVAARGLAASESRQK